MPNKNPVDCSHAQIASAIKMAILNYAKHLPLNLQMGNLLLETIINFLIAIVKMCTCRECAEHLRECAIIEPFFQIYPFYHEKDYYLRDYKQKRFIIKWKPPLNVKKNMIALLLYI